MGARACGGCAFFRALTAALRPRPGVVELAGCFVDYFPGQAPADVGELLRSPDRRASVRGADRSLVPLHPGFDISGFDEGLAEQLGDITAAAPLRGKQFLKLCQVLKLLDHIGALEPG